MDNNIQNYRQPMVTATGIILGFILNFTVNWATKAFEENRKYDIEIAISLLVCITSLIIVLYRILNMNYPREKSNTYYKKTLVLFIIGLATPFITIFSVKIESMITESLK